MKINKNNRIYYYKLLKKKINKLVKLLNFIKLIKIK